MGEARIVVDSREAPAVPAPVDARAASPPSRKRRILQWGAATLATVGVAAAGWFFARAGIPAPAVIRLSISLPFPLAAELDTPSVAISSDGSALAYVGRNNGKTGIYVRAMDRVEVRLLAGTEGAMSPVFSPDGTWIAFVADKRLK